MFIATRRHEPQTVMRSFLDHLAVERGASANTLAAYRRDLNRYLDYLAGLGVESVADVDAVTVSGFLAYLREGDADHPALSASSVARAIAAVRGLHRFALDVGLVPVDVSREVRPAAPPRRLPKAISVEDVERLLDAAGYAGTAFAVRDRALLELLYGTGARISEAVGLHVDDLDLTDNTVLLTGKGDKQRRVPGGADAPEGLSGYPLRSRPPLAASGARSPPPFLPP